jgi:hypothetical protein
VYLVLSVKNQLHLNPEFNTISRGKKTQTNPSKPFVLPAPAENNDLVIRYLKSRGISAVIIKQFISQGLIYQDKLHGNVVFVGKDKNGKAKNAMMRGTGRGSTFKKDAHGSNKNYSFSCPAEIVSDHLRIFESAIDLLSDITIREYEGQDWSDVHRLSLGGLAANALEQYLRNYSEIRQITLCLDNDEPGLTAAKEFSTELISKGFSIQTVLPPMGKDYNEYLCNYYEKERNDNSSHKQKSQKEER